MGGERVRDSGPIAKEWAPARGREEFRPGEFLQVGQHISAIGGWDRLQYAG